MSDLTPIKNDNLLKPFFDRNEEFDLENYNLFDETAVNALNWQGVDKDKICDRLKGCQRLLSLGIEPSDVIQLLDSSEQVTSKSLSSQPSPKLDSALAIASISEEKFVKVSPFASEKAREVHRQATQKTASSMVLLANVMQFSSSRQQTMLPDNADSVRESFKSLPSYQKLFGSLDYLQCEHCQSIFGPAAYFVDLMQIVDRYITEVNDIPEKQKLSDRRPDLENIELTCDNTNDTVHYTQIVSEVLAEKLKADIGEDVFRHLATAKYPRNLPFNLYLEQIRLYLGHLNSNLPTIYQTFHPQEPDSITWAREYLGLSPEEYASITTANSQTSDLTQRYGIDVSQGNLGGLTQKETFLKQTGLSWRELDDLFYQNLSSQEIQDGVAHNFYINQGLSGTEYLKHEAGQISNLTAATLDRLDRFLRLASKLDWSFADLDWVLTSIGATDINEGAIKKIAKIKQLQGRTQLPLEIPCSFWHDMKTTGKGDKNNRPQDLFDRVFNNPLVLQGQAQWAANSSVAWNFSESATGNSDPVRSRLLAALQLSDRELTDIVKGIWATETTIQLNLANLSRLYRTSQVLKLLGLTVEEYQLLLEFLDQSFESLASLEIDRLIEIVEFAEWLKLSGFSTYELDYILNGTVYPTVDVFLPEENMASVMESLWEKVELPGNGNSLTAEERNSLDEELAIHFGIESGFSVLAKLAATSVQAPDYLQLLLTEVPTTDDSDWQTIVSCLQFISRMQLLVSKLALTETELKSISTYPEAYNITSLTALTVQNIQNLYNCKNQLIPVFGSKDNLANFFEKPQLPQPISSWLLNEGTGTTIADGMGKYNGALKGSANWQTVTDFPGSPSRQVLQFDGSSNYVELTTTPNLSLYDSDFTVETWIEADDLPDEGDRSIIGTDERSQNEGFFLMTQHRKALMGFFANDQQGTAELQVGKWYQIVWRYIKSTGEQAIFIQGRLDASSEGHTSFKKIDTVYIGRSGGGRYFKGKIANVRIWNLALTNEQILDNYENQNPSPPPPQPKGSWLLNEGTGTTIADETGNHNGQLHGSANWQTVTDFPGSPSRQVLQFDGSSNYVELTTAPNLGLYDSDLTIEGWIKVNTFDNTVQEPIIGSVGNSRNNSIGLIIQSSSKQAMLTFYYNTTAGQTTLESGKWYNLVGRYKKATGEQAIFIDGQLESTNENRDPFVGEGMVNIGCRGSNYLDGKVANVRIWDVALSDEQILENYQTTASPSPTPSPSKAEKLVELTGWKREQIDPAIDLLQDQALYNSVAGLLKLKQCIDLSATLGSSPEFLGELCDLLENGSVASNWTTYQQVASSVISLAKAKYDNDEWEKVVEKLKGTLEERKCQILTEFTLWQLNLEHPRQLSEYLLLDVEMTSCACNSKIQLAILSVQTYLQRCRMGVEAGVNQVNIPSVWWEWITNYRIWEANRKIFLYPENYIDPSLRQNSSPIFKELEDELLQSEITAETAEAAYRNYFDKLAELAKLQIVDSCRYSVQTPKSPEAIETQFIFAKTQTEPHTFYYRRCERPMANKPLWGYWEKIDLQINSDYLAPVYAFNRLFVFWVETKEIKKSQDEEPAIEATVKYSFLNASQKWVLPQTLVADVEIPPNVEVDRTFWEQVYPLVDSTSPSEEEKITILWGGLSAILSKQFNDKSKLFQLDLNHVTTIASDLLPASMPLREKSSSIELSVARSQLAATTVGNLAIFAGGDSNGGISDTLDVFEYQYGTLENKGLGLRLSVARRYLAVTKVGNLVIFAGGHDGAGYSKNTVDVFAYQDGTLVKKELNLIISSGRTRLAATTVGNLAIFAGGIYSGSADGDVMDVFAYQNGTLVKKELNLKLSRTCSDLAATTVENLAIFAGGFSQNRYSDAVDVFQEQNGTLENTGLNLKLSVGRSRLAATTVGNLAIFAGGDSNNGDSDAVDVFEYQDGTLVKKELDLTLSVARRSLVATTVGNLAIFAGGDSNNGELDAVDVFEYQDGTLVKKELDLRLSQGRQELAATTVGNLAIFAGGIGSGKRKSNVDVFQLPNPALSALPSSLELPTNTTVTPIKHQSQGFILKQRSEAFSSLPPEPVSGPPDTGSGVTNLTTSAIKLSVARKDLAATIVGKLAIFAGGESNGGFSDAVDVFEDQNGTLVKKELNLRLSEARRDLAATTVGNLAIFAGGTASKTFGGTGSIQVSTDTVDVFEYQDGTLVKKELDLRLSSVQGGLVATTVGNLAIFAGRGVTHIMVVDVFEYQDGTLVKKELSFTSFESRYSFAVTTVGNLAIFAGGYDSRLLDTVDVFEYQNETLVKKEIDLKLFEECNGLAGTTAGNLAIFAGGYRSSSGISDVVEVFEDQDGTLVKKQIYLKLSQARRCPIATTVGNLAIFAGGYDNNSTGLDTVDVFEHQDGTLVKKELDLKLSVARKDLAATTVGNLAIFAGGRDNTGYSDTVDVFYVPSPNEQPSHVTRLTTSAVRQFGHTLFARGLDGLLSLESQSIPEPEFPLVANNQLDFNGAYGPYFWEVFFHIPFLIASTFNSGQRYNEARQWYQYIFDPTIPGEDKDRFWRFLPFQGHTPQELEEILTNEAAIQAYKESPFDPHAIARLRVGAYQKTVVMRYIDNLLDWGDALFAQDSWESITQATTLYMLAYDLLGPKPENVGEIPAPVPTTFANIKAGQGRQGSISEFLIELETVPDNQQVIDLSGDDVPFNAIDAYFCVSENEEFAKYWDRVEDRLFKIRHCQNIQGIERQLALFQPPIDPMQLVRLAAAGGSAIALSAAGAGEVPHYRFSHLLERAKGIASTVIQLGSTLLNTLEKKDAEELALLRASQEAILLQLITTTKEKQIEEAEATLASLERSLEGTKERFQYYQDLIAEGWIAGEKASVVLMGAALYPQIAATAIRGISIAGYLAPNTFGLANGGMQFGDAVNAGSLISDGIAGILNHSASIASTVAQFQRREEDWEFQQLMAEWDTQQIQEQIEAAKVRVEMAKAELEVHQKSIEHAREIEQFLKDKFTNKELYQWMVGRLSGLHFQTYKIALAMAYSAQKAYQYELNKDNTYIQSTYWDSTKKGLLAGESLMLGLNQLEKAYLDGDERRLEIEKIVSLRQLDPRAFLELKTNGTCEFSLDEKLFALDFPSHYCRQIKTISVSIPAVVGPYQNIHATLTQTSNKVLIEPDADAVKWLLTAEGNEPDTGTLRVGWRQNQQIAISKGVNDNGLFVLNFQDERYLPFEGTGVISDWTLKLPKASNAIDLDSITDVIVTVSYTALEGGSTISNAVTQNFQKFTGQVVANLKQELLQNSTPNSLSFAVSPHLFRANLTNYKISKVYLQPFGASNLPNSLTLEIPDGGQGIPLTKNSDNAYSSGNNSLNKSYNMTAATWSLHDSGLFDPQNVTDIVLIVDYEGDIQW